MNIDELMELSKINPLIRFDRVCDEKTKDTSITILLALYTIDKVIRDNTGKKYFYYIQDDKSVYYLLTHTVKKDMSKEEFERGLFCVDFSKLIYRFTCAKKFKIEDDLISQLRINSWGRELIKEQNLLVSKEAEYKYLYDYFNQYFKEHESVYLNLVDKLVEPLTDETVRTIQDQNEKIEIQLLS